MKCMCHEYYYIGSTTRQLAKRFSEHKLYSKTNTNRLVYKIFNECGWENVKILLMSSLKLENIEQLRKAEDDMIQPNMDDNNCLNSCRAFLTQEERRGIPCAVGNIQERMVQ